MNADIFKRYFSPRGANNLKKTEYCPYFQKAESAKRKEILIADRLNYASIIAGCRLPFGAVAEAVSRQILRGSL